MGSKLTFGYFCSATKVTRIGMRNNPLYKLLVSKIPLYKCVEI